MSLIGKYIYIESMHYKLENPILGCKLFFLTNYSSFNIMRSENQIDITTNRCLWFQNYIHESVSVWFHFRLKRRVNHSIVIQFPFFTPTLRVRGHSSLQVWRCYVYYNMQIRQAEGFVYYAYITSSLVFLCIYIVYPEEQTVIEAQK